MRKTLLLAALLLGSAPADAGTAIIQSQFTLQEGFNQTNGQPNCGTWVAGQGQACTTVPGTILGWSGTVTVKNPGVELLSQLFCAGQVIWQGEQFQGTLVVTSPASLPNNLTGPCWVSSQADSQEAGTGWEIQMTFFYQ